MNTSSLFNDNDPKDPFNKTPDPKELSNESWIESSGNRNVPRWTLKTDQERKEQDNVIKKLEAKMKRIKQKKYTYNDIRNTNLDISDDSLSVDDDEEHITDDEGSPLILKSKTIKKTENQYTRSWFNCCC